MSEKQREIKRASKREGWRGEEKKKNKYMLQTKEHKSFVFITQKPAYVAYLFARFGHFIEGIGMNINIFRSTAFNRIDVAAEVHTDNTHTATRKTIKLYSNNTYLKFGRCLGGLNRRLPICSNAIFSLLLHSSQNLTNMQCLPICMCGLF